MLREISDSIRNRYLLLAGFGRAVRYKITRDMARVKLPEPSTSGKPRDDIEQLFVKNTIQRAEKLVNRLVRFTTRKCFFRAYTSAYVLRKNGIAVTLNIGLHHLHKSDRSVRGHSWLSRQDHPLEEPSDPRVRYSRFLGTGQNGVAYWLGGEKTDKHKIVRYRKVSEGFEKDAVLGN